MSQEYDDDCYYKLFSFSNPIARKSHRCMACSEKITPGSQYEVISGLSDGDFVTTKRCARCVAIYNHLRGRARQLNDGTTPDFFLDCGHSYEEVHKEPPPPDIAALAFALPGELKILD